MGSLILSGGCAAAQRGNRQAIARVDRTSKPTTAPAASGEVMERVKYAGVYRVVIRKPLWFANVSSTQARFDAGDLIGFTWDESGRVIAVGLNRQIEIGPLPRSARYITWQSIKLDQTKPSRGSSALELVFGAFAVVGIILLVPAIIAAEWVLSREGVLVDYRHR